MSGFEIIKRCLVEKDDLVGHCEILLELVDNYEQKVVCLGKANEELKKSQDPWKSRALIDLVAMAEKTKDIKSITARMNKLKK